MLSLLLSASSFCSVGAAEKEGIGEFLRGEDEKKVGGANRANPYGVAPEKIDLVNELIAHPDFHSEGLEIMVQGYGNRRPTPDFLKIYTMLYDAV